MAYQAYIDDSIGTDGTYVLAGHIATTEQWAEFSQEWKALLRFGTLDKTGDYHFHMVEMAQSEERMERVIAFRRIIEKYAILSIAIKVNVNDLKAAIHRIYVHGFDINFTHYKHPFIFSLFGLMRTFNENRIKFDHLIPAHEPVHFFFDESEHRRLVTSTWRRFTKSIPDDWRHLYESTPNFGDDKVHLPLQAADLWAWWVRKRYEQGERDRLFGGDVFDRHLEQRYVPKVFVEYKQDKIVKNLIETVKSSITSGISVLDVKSAPNESYSVAFSMPLPIRLHGAYSMRLHII
jgi:hypothetical protein